MKVEINYYGMQLCTSHLNLKHRHDVINHVIHGVRIQQCTFHVDSHLANLSDRLDLLIQCTLNDAHIKHVHHIYLLCYFPTLHLQYLA